MVRSVELSPCGDDTEIEDVDEWDRSWVGACPVDANADLLIVTTEEPLTAGAAHVVTWISADGLAGCCGAHHQVIAALHEQHLRRVWRVVAVPCPLMSQADRRVAEAKARLEAEATAAVTAAAAGPQTPEAEASRARARALVEELHDLARRYAGARRASGAKLEKISFHSTPGYWFSSAGRFQTEWHGVSKRGELLDRSDPNFADLIKKCFWTATYSNHGDSFEWEESAENVIRQLVDRFAVEVARVEVASATVPKRPWLRKR